MASANPGAGNQGRVLLCGETFSTPEVRAALARLGYEVAAVAEDTEAAVRAARSLRPEVVLIDGDFPPHGGVGTTRRIARESPTVVIIARDSGDPQWVRRAMEAGASGYLTLPLRLDDLGPALLLASTHFGQFRLYERLATEMREANERLLISGLREQQYATQLRKLSDIAAEIQATDSLDAMLETVACRSRELLECELAGIRYAGASRTVWASAAAPGRPAVQAELSPSVAALFPPESGRDTVRLPAGAVRRRRDPGEAPVEDDLRGVLAACLRGAKGDARGVLWLAGRREGEFTEEDEAVLRQIAQLTSLALSPARFGCEQE